MQETFKYDDLETDELRQLITKLTERLARAKTALARAKGGEEDDALASAIAALPSTESEVCIPPEVLRHAGLEGEREHT